MNEACKRNDLTEVKELIRKETRLMFGPLSTPKLISYALLKASQYGKMDIVKYLIEEEGSFPNLTMIKTATIHHHHDVRKYLIKKKYG